VTTGEARLPITVAIVARDEERDLPAAIASVPFAAEVVVVLDPRTRDRTRDAALTLDRPDRPVRVVERPWEGHVAQKGFALSLAREPWVLSLDADERVEPALAAEIEALFRGGPAAEGYTVGRRTLYLGRWMRGSGWYPDRKLRLVRRGAARWTGEDPHDRLEASGRVEDLLGSLEHRSYRDLSDHLRKLDDFTEIAAREKRGRGVRRPVLRMLVHPPARFLKMYLLKRGFRDGVPGAVAAGMGALYAFLKYAKLWELEEEGRRVPAGAVPRGPA
jgi:glycosyltransferase involved in cell wall biosynthesis